VCAAVAWLFSLAAQRTGVEAGACVYPVEKLELRTTAISKETLLLVAI
jgi:hypothetical protein